MAKNTNKNYEEVIKILVRYNDYLIRPRDYIGFSALSKKRNEDVAKYVSSVNRALINLSNEDRAIIENDFIRHKIDPYWWTPFYSRATYYRRRSNAVNAFMENFAL